MNDGMQQAGAAFRTFGAVVGKLLRGEQSRLAGRRQFSSTGTVFRQSSLPLGQSAAIAAVNAGFCSISGMFGTVASAPNNEVFMVLGWCIAGGWR